MGARAMDIESNEPNALQRQGSTVKTNATSVQWKDLSVTISKKKQPVTILHPTTGMLEAGDVLAVMGPSGSGKTTLLDAIAGRTKESKVSGAVYFNGQPNVPFAQRNRLLSYVAQEDSLLGVFTVAESLRFAVRFYHGYGTANTAALEAEALSLVGLESARETLVGDIFRKGLSGGQKRRLSLAVELVKQPAVLILDEPTSGLDSASAFGVMQRLCAMAKAGHALAITIHQPSSELWALFDKFLLLSAGRTVYYGRAEDTVRYFGDLGHPCPSTYNPADFVLALVNQDFPDRYDEGLAAKYPASKECAATSAAVEEAIAAGQGKGLGGREDNFRLKPLSTFVTLSHRFLLNNARNPGIYWVRLVMYVMLCLMIGLMYIGLGDEFDYSSVNSRTSMLFYIAAFLVFMSVAVLPFFMMERPTFLRERTNGAYGVGAWTLANFLCSLPGLALISILSTVCVVPLAGLNGFGVFFAALLCSLIAAEGFMCLIGAVSPHYIIGIALGAGVYGFFMLCEGAFKVQDDIPPWFIWVHYIGFHTYSYRVFMWNEFHDIKQFDADAPFASGMELLRFYSFENVDVARDLGALVGFGVFFHVCFALVLQFFHTGRR